MNLSEQLEETRSKILEAITKWDTLMHERCVDYKSTDLAEKEGYQKGLVAGYSYMETMLVEILELLENTLRTDQDLKTLLKSLIGKPGNPKQQV
jgi:hypothetical protein